MQTQKTTRSLFLLPVSVFYSKLVPHYSFLSLFAKQLSVTLVQMGKQSVEVCREQAELQRLTDGADESHIQVDQKDTA